MSLGDRIRRSQVLAGEQTVIDHLREMWIATKQAEYNLTSANEEDKGENKITVERFAMIVKSDVDEFVRACKQTGMDNDTLDSFMRRYIMSCIDAG